MTSRDHKHELSLDMPAVHREVRVARYVVRNFARMEGLKDREIEQLVLIVSELLANAIDHGGGSPAMTERDLSGDPRMRLSLVIGEREWLLAVSDEGGGDPARVLGALKSAQLPDLEDERGRGLDHREEALGGREREVEIAHEIKDAADSSVFTYRHPIEHDVVVLLGPCGVGRNCAGDDRKEIGNSTKFPQVFDVGIKVAQNEDVILLPTIVLNSVENVIKNVHFPIHFVRISVNIHQGKCKRQIGRCRSGTKPSDKRFAMERITRVIDRVKLIPVYFDRLLVKHECILLLTCRTSQARPNDKIVVPSAGVQHLDKSWQDIVVAGSNLLNGYDVESLHDARNDFHHDRFLELASSKDLDVERRDAQGGAGNDVRREGRGCRRRE